MPHVNAVAVASFCVWVIAFSIFLSGDIAICDLGEGCGPGFPEWLFYATAWAALTSFIVLLTSTLALLVRRLKRRSNL